MKQDVKNTAVQTNGGESAKKWQIALFALNNSSTNLILCLMGYVAYYASGVAGLVFLVVSYLITGMRVFDAVTDPIIGYLMDKLNFGKLGKFRPWMVAGHLIMCLALCGIFFTVHLVPSVIRLAYFILLYSIYIIGYTCQTACTKAAQSCLTKNASQRPLFTMFDSFYCLVVFGGSALYVSNYLQPKYGDFTTAFFNEFVITVLLICTVLTCLSVFGLWGRDIVLPDANTRKAEKVALRDYLRVLKQNDALRKLVLCAGIDKLAAQCATNSITCVVVFGIILGDYSWYGKMSILSAIPIVIIVSIGTRLCQKKDMRKVVMGINSAALVVLSSLTLLILFGGIDSIGRGEWTAFGILFLALYALERALQMFATNLFIPMVADCTDYEEYLSGRKMPGMIGTLYSFADKLVSSLAATVVGTTVAIAGFGAVAPTVDTALTTGLQYAGTFCVFGLPIIAALVSIGVMMRYPLTREKMLEVQAALQMRRQEKETESV
ncbi:MAG: MFS transporter [Faecalibacterium sp.]